MHFEDDFEVLERDPDGKKFDKGKEGRPTDSNQLRESGWKKKKEGENRSGG